MRAATIAAALAALLVSGTIDGVRAQPGSGMMGQGGPMPYGWNQGQPPGGWMGQGWMGPGMQGMGPGMMGPMMQGQGGPGMMGQGWGPGQQGWGMMGPMMQGQGGPGMMMGPGMMGHGMMMAGNVDAYLASAKTQLGIDASQEQAWNTYVEAVKQAAATMAGQRQAMMSACMQGQMSMPDMQAQMSSMMEARLAAAKDITATARALYDQLNPQQRVLADRLLPPGMGMM